jgi:hypothetical protein
LLNKGGDPVFSRRKKKKKKEFQSGSLLPSVKLGREEHICKCNFLNLFPPIPFST